MQEMCVKNSVMLFQVDPLRQIVSKNFDRPNLASDTSLCFRPLSDAWFVAKNGLKSSDRVFFNRIPILSDFIVEQENVAAFKILQK